jgi:hypothetical protein
MKDEGLTASLITHHSSFITYHASGILSSSAIRHARQGMGIGIGRPSASASQPRMMR